MRDKLKAEHEIEEETSQMGNDEHDSKEQMLIDQDLEHERMLIMKRRQKAAEVTTCTLIVYN